MHLLVGVSHWLATRSNDISPQENYHISRAFELIHEDRFSFIETLAGEQKTVLRKNMIDIVLATDMKNHFSLLDSFRSRDPSSMLTQQLVIKVVDISHLSATWDVHLRWVYLLQEELFLQGDHEKANGLKVSPLMARSGKGVSKMQVGFFNVIADPLYEVFHKAFPSCAPLQTAMHRIYKKWKTLQHVFLGLPQE